MTTDSSFNLRWQVHTSTPINMYAQAPTQRKKDVGSFEDRSCRIFNLCGCWFSWERAPYVTKSGLVLSILYAPSWLGTRDSPASAPWVELGLCHHLRLSLAIEIYVLTRRRIWLECKGPCMIRWRMIPQTQTVCKRREGFILQKSSLLGSLIPRWRPGSELTVQI